MARVYNQMMRVHISTAKLYEGVALATLPITLSIPAGGAYLKITLSGGSSNSGSVRIIGPTGGYEDIVFTSGRWKVSEDLWTGIPTITTTGIVDEAVVSTITVECSDAAGNLIEWDTYSSVPCSIRAMKALGFQYLIQVKQAGTYAPGMYNVFVKGNPIGLLSEGSEFTVGKLDGVFMVASEVQQHLQSRTNRVDELNFIAVKRG